MSGGLGSWLAPRQQGGVGAAVLLVRIVLGAAMMLAGWGKVGPQLGFCPPALIADCEREQREACGGDAVCEGLIPARCSDERRAACREKAESAKRYFAGLRWLGDPAMPFPSGGGLMLWAAGLAELVGGALVLLGLLARLAAIPLAFVMAVAMATAHVDTFEASGSFLTEPALLLFVLALVVLGCGPGRLSLDGQFAESAGGGGKRAGTAPRPGGKR